MNTKPFPTRLRKRVFLFVGGTLGVLYGWVTACAVYAEASATHLGSFGAYNPPWCACAYQFWPAYDFTFTGDMIVYFFLPGLLVAWLFSGVWLLVVWGGIWGIAWLVGKGDCFSAWWEAGRDGAVYDWVNFPGYLMLAAVWMILFAMVFYPIAHIKWWAVFSRARWIVTGFGLPVSRLIGIGLILAGVGLPVTTLLLTLVLGDRTAMAWGPLLVFSLLLILLGIGFLRIKPRTPQK